MQISDVCIDTDSPDNTAYSGRLRITLRSNTGAKYVYVTKEGFVDAPGYNLSGSPLSFTNLAPPSNNTSVNLGVKAAGGANYCSYKINAGDQIEFTCPIKAGSGTPSLQGTPAALPNVSSGDAHFGIDSDGKFKVREVSGGTTGSATS